MTNQRARFIARMSFGLTAVFVASASWAQQEPRPADPKEGAVLPSQESPLRRSPSTTDVNGKSVPVTSEKLVLADPDSKMYMPCRGPNDSKSTDAASKPIKLNPKAAVLSEEAAKQHGFKPSAHQVDCPKQEAEKK